MNEELTVVLLFLFPCPAAISKTQPRIRSLRTYHCLRRRRTWSGSSGYSGGRECEREVRTGSSGRPKSIGLFISRAPLVPNLCVCRLIIEAGIVPHSLLDTRKRELLLRSTDGFVKFMRESRVGDPSKSKFQDDIYPYYLVTARSRKQKRKNGRENNGETDKRTARRPTPSSPGIRVRRSSTSSSSTTARSRSLGSCVVEACVDAASLEDGEDEGRRVGEVRRDVAVLEAVLEVKRLISRFRKD